MNVRVYYKKKKRGFLIDIVKSVVVDVRDEDVKNLSHEKLSKMTGVGKGRIARHEVILF